MSRSERDIVRKNKPLKNPAALRVALKIEPTTPNDLSDSTPSDAKSIPTSRFVSCSATKYEGQVFFEFSNVVCFPLFQSYATHSSGKC